MSDHRATNWEQVYHEQMPRIYNFFRYRVYDDTLAEDLTATTFERAWRYRHSYAHDRAAFAVWLFSIARNVAKGHLRKQPPEIALDDTHLQIASGERSPEAMAVLGDDLRQLTRMLSQLSERERELISLKYGAGLNNRAIASLTGLSESNVGTILHRAVKSIRAQWEPAL